jgi:hypothetical protein|tara:strand:+ start:1043 stop:1507 length:465 start_codon:yes stop_codon:yes gene_type:complete
MKKKLHTAIVTVGLVLLSVSAQTQQSGVIAPPPPVDIHLEVTTGPMGQPILSAKEFELLTGGYYRLNFSCPDVKGGSSGFQFEATRLVANSHIRVFSVGNIELYLQGQTFRAIQCDEAGSARFSFHPMRKGIYDVNVTDHSDPPQQALARIVVE